MITKEQPVYEQITLEPIGYVESPVKDRTDEHWGIVESTIKLKQEFWGGMRGLETFSRAIIVTFLHQAHFEKTRHLIRRPQGREDMPMLGIFSQRAKNRPNPIGITAVKILGVKEGELVVKGLDAVDGTPVLDIKPYFPQYDRVEDADTPSWVAELMKTYF